MINFRIVVIKGIIEHNNPEIYFGNKKGVPSWIEEAIKAGLLEIDNGEFKVTTKGYNLYRDLELDKLPKEGIAYTWKDKECMDE